MTYTNTENYFPWCFASRLSQVSERQKQQLALYPTTYPRAGCKTIHEPGRPAMIWK